MKKELWAFVISSFIGFIILILIFGQVLKYAESYSDMVGGGFLFRFIFLRGYTINRSQKQLNKGLQ
jgi:hypothetical protein